MKIFLWFWLCMIIIIAAVAVVVIMHLGGLRGSEWRILADKSLALHGMTAVRAYEEGGGERLARFLGRGEQETATRVFVFQGLSELSGRSVDRRIAALAAKAEQSKKSEILSLESVAFVAHPVSGHKGALYVVIVETEKSGYFKQVWTLRPFIVMKIVGILLFSALFCFALSYNLTSSIRKLRTATRRLAAGDLSSRVLAVFGERNDELSDLAGDFDQMAERIESLLTSQKQLLSDISHELRSPLARLNVALDLCRCRADSSMQEHLARMERDADRLNEMIGQLLELSRMEARIIERKPVSVNLKELMIELIEDADFEARNRGCAVRLVSADACTVSGSPEHLRSAAENVIRNALHFTREGTAVEVELRNPAIASMATILVRDHGPGVPGAELSKIFRPFYRVEQARDRCQGGAGLGLAITDRIITLHGGRVRACNATDGVSGLCIEIDIPNANENV